MNEFFQLIDDLRHPTVMLEWGLLLSSLGLAWLVARVLQNRRGDRASVWLGERPLQSLLFPVCALALVYISRVVLQQQHVPVAVLRIALPVLMSLVLIRFMARVLTAAFPSSSLVRLVERFVSWVAWLGAVLWITGWLPWVLTELESIRLNFGKTHVDLRTLLEGLVSSVLVLVSTLWLSSTLERRVLASAVQDLSMRKVAGNALRALLLFVGLLLSLSAVGVDLTALSVLGGAIGVGLGFGLQKMAANYVSGFVILLERSLRIGDHVKVDGFEGKVTDIKTRYTLIRAVNGRESIVPNELLMSQRVENLSLADPSILLTCNVTVAYGNDVPRVQQLLIEAAASCPRVLSEPGPVAHLLQLGQDGLEFLVAFWIRDPDNGQTNVRSAVNIAILEALRAAQVQVPYPSSKHPIDRVPQVP
ncbi:MAG: mechanosensitive ion channel [Limnohabitans sp.]|nr:mechanosensitive ion channel [Limnohabitans sp.]